MFLTTSYCCHGHEHSDLAVIFDVFVNFESVYCDCRKRWIFIG